MVSLHELPRTVAVCTDCGRPTAAREMADGTLLPIAGKRCSCGSHTYETFG